MKKVLMSMAKAMSVAFNTDEQTALQEVERFPVDLQRDELVVGYFKDLCTTQSTFLSHRIKEVITSPKKLTKWKLQGERRERKMRIKTFVKDYHQGTYYVAVRNHALAVKEGTALDPEPKGITEKHIVKYALLIEPA